MTSSNFPLRGLTDSDRYLLKRAALENGVSANTLVLDIVRRELDRMLPGVRDVYDHRVEIAEQALRRQGIDPASPDYAEARRDARAVLARADQLRQGNTA
ncbi:hypothetical protein [Nocardia seriolae]|uniref:Uncharacterized protein n=1 Tax=Nocardia seriolae TaxID=37332 RepID=A0ABC8B656_9NOCA|nr:hypothetical protein [Nocardia seriolae]APB01605.1 hypothetical protein NS506_07585 [Nocardia seriolae]MTJ60922.1 hypothetical protein [Nocardia seriolae]MTJ75295.1 hypothetical protein [Nocardia seriolae]MTJ90943.1 hypothetical protein [Nocardia seriolae]MTK34900.1 hypothetical protein [Nocardia seriolae]